MTAPSDDVRLAVRREAERAAARIVTGTTQRMLLDARGRIDERYWRHCREQGWTAIGIAEEHGGIGLGLAELCVVAEVFGTVAAGAALLETGFAAAQAIARHGSAATRSEWLPALARGEASATLSIVDGSELVPGRPTILWDEGRVSGRRAAVPAGGIADVAILSVAAGAAPGLALVDLRVPEVRRTLPDTFDNSRCTADLAFANAPAVLLDTPDPVAALGALLDVQAVVVAHQQLGGAGAMLAAARGHALRRRAFGQPIGVFQSIKHRIAEGYVLIELARASAAAALAADGAAFSREAMAARLLATDAYETVTRDAVQIHGGIGVTWEADLHLHQRRARTLALELGPIMAWEDRLAEMLAGGGA